MGANQGSMSAEKIKSLRLRAKMCGKPAEKAALNAQADRLETGEAPPQFNATALGLEGLEGLKIKMKEDRSTFATACCPTCRAKGGDAKSEHLYISPSGRFSCVTVQEDETDLGQRHQHLSDVWHRLGGSLTGLAELPKPDPTLAKRQKEALRLCLEKWESIKAEYSMSLEDWQCEGDPVPTDPYQCFQIFASWFQPGDFVWCGGLYDAGQTVADHLHALPGDVQKAWEQIERERVDLTMGWTLRPNATTRGLLGYKTRRLYVLEHDGPVDNRTSIEHQVALARYAINELGLKPLAAVSTSGKGFHLIVDAAAEPPVTFVRISTHLRAMGSDHNSWANSRTRIPGAVRQPTETNPGGKRQMIVWLPKTNS